MRLKKLFINVLAISLLPLELLSQNPPPPPGGTPPGFPIPGILILIISAIGYGIFISLRNPKK